MNDERDRVMAGLRGALASRPERTTYPDWDEADLVARSRLPTGERWEDFVHNLEAVNGRAMRRVEELVDFLAEQGCRFGHCAPEWEERIGGALRAAGIEVEAGFDRERFEDYQFGITTGSGAIAETGTVVLTDRETSDRLAALVPWIHVAVIRMDQLVATLPEAIEAFGDHGNVVWATGPSKTADVEGILIEGVHGPGEQICLCLEEGGEEQRMEEESRKERVGARGAGVRASQRGPCGGKRNESGAPS